MRFGIVQTSHPHFFAQIGLFGVSNRIETTEIQR
jgi:hypothetical protein